MYQPLVPSVPTVTAAVVTGAVRSTLTEVPTVTAAVVTGAVRSTLTKVLARSPMAICNQPLFQLWDRTTPPTYVCKIPALVICWSSVAMSAV